MANRPNVLCFVTDQQRGDHLGCYDNPVLRTPNIDRIADTGVCFTRSYVNNPLCMPCRSTLFTGMTPRGHSVRTNGIQLRRDLPTVPQALTEAGYRTHSTGKLHLNAFSTPNGLDPQTLEPECYPEARQMWDSGRLDKLPLPYYGLESADFCGGHGNWIFGEYVNWLRQQDPGAYELIMPQAGTPSALGAEQSWAMALPQELHYNRWVADRAIDFIRGHAGSEQPFFLWCSFPDPHHPFCPPEPWASAYDPADIPLPTRRERELDDLAPFFRQIYTQRLQLSGRGSPTRMRDDQIREILALTYGMISFVDQEVGRVLDVVEELGMREDTVICYLSDHGDLMGDHWLLNKGPFHFEGLLRVPFLWSWPGHFSQGVMTRGLSSHLDFAPTILDLCGVPIPEGLVPAVPEAPLAPPPWPGRSLLPQLCGSCDAVRHAALVENDEDYLGLRLRTLVTDRYKLTLYPGQAYGELFDLREDPGEVHNRWADPAYAALRTDLQLALLDEIVLTDSALPRRLTHA